MSTAGLFVAGTVVTLLVTASMALLIWGASSTDARSPGPMASARR